MEKIPVMNWQPLAMLPVLAGMLDEQFGELSEQLELLHAAKARPLVMDGQMRSRLIEVHGEQRDLLSLYRQQASRWLREVDSTSEQSAQVERFCDLIAKVDTVLGEILEIAHGVAAR